MKSLKAWFLFAALLTALHLRAQQMELFMSLQTGMPFRITGAAEPPIFLNCNIGAELYVTNKLSSSVSFRKLFYAIGKESNLEHKQLYHYNGYNYVYTEEYSSYAIDLEAKYFFNEAANDGVYLASGLSFQHLIMTVNMLSVDQLYNTSPAVLYPGRFSDKMNIYPFSIKVGKRSAGETLVFDYFFGIAFNLGAHSIKRINEQYLDYYKFKTVSIPFGVTIGVKF